MLKNAPLSAMNSAPKPFTEPVSTGLVSTMVTGSSAYFSSLQSAARAGPASRARLTTALRISHCEIQLTSSGLAPRVHK